MHEGTVLRRAYPADLATVAPPGAYGEARARWAGTRTWLRIALAAAVLAGVLIALAIAAGAR